MFFQSIGLSPDETIEAYMATRREDNSLYERSNSKRRMIFSVLAAVDIFGDLSFARREGSYNSNHFVESLKTLRPTSGDVHLSHNVAFHHSPLRSSFCRFYREVELLFIPPYASTFNRVEGVFAIVKRNDRSSERIAEAFSTR